MLCVFKLTKKSYDINCLQMNAYTHARTHAHSAFVCECVRNVRFLCFDSNVSYEKRLLYTFFVGR